MLRLLTAAIALCASITSANAASIKPLETSRVNGENGWYVPQLDSTFEWIDRRRAVNILERLEAIETRVVLPVRFFLYTSANPTNGQELQANNDSISNSNFNSAHPTRFLIHGWLQSYTASSNTVIRDAFLNLGDHNIIIVDYARARGPYTFAVAGVSRDGIRVASFVDYLVQNHGLSLANLYIIGMSLGTHVAGHTGKNVQSGQIHTIIGLDPAMPLFSYDQPNNRLSSEDAYYVESIHTNGGQLGFLKPIGKAAFYPNGGQSQPNCNIDLLGACSHGRVTTYYVEAVRLNNFGSIRCHYYEDAVDNNCGSTFSSIRMGAAVNADSAEGVFYVPINNNSPYGVTE